MAPCHTPPSFTAVGLLRAYLQVCKHYSLAPAGELQVVLSAQAVLRVGHQITYGLLVTCLPVEVRGSMRGRVSGLIQWSEGLVRWSDGLNHWSGGLNHILHGLNHWSGGLNHMLHGLNHWVFGLNHWSDGLNHMPHGLNQWARGVIQGL